MSSYEPIPYRPDLRSIEEVAQTLVDHYAQMATRRSVRMFASKPVPKEVIETAIKIAGTAPSGANRQPWHFVAVSNPEIKQRIREAAEKEERSFYDKRAPKEWLDALEPLGTDFCKSHITDAPWVIVAFREDYVVSADGQRVKNYYMTESVGIAVGFLLYALHCAGLCALTHTPSPMTFLRVLCGRPDSEKPLLLIPVGYPSPECVVPNIERKELGEIATFL